ncbi:MAG: outer membrane beta-barrel protein [Bacteroidales bacterium]|jgi:hypothetical protein|nr:PorT family protein [Bacteroidales bacterium]MDD4214159.1 outer membrane beta-barrel protein [Bacteroidales bacterium]
MKKLFFLTISVLLLNSLIASGQKYNVGIKAGMNIIPLEKHELKGNLFNLGYHFGATAEYKVNNWFSVSAELLYTTRKKTYSLYDTSSFIETLSTNPLITMMGMDINDILDSIGDISNYVNDGVFSTTSGYTNLAYIKIPVLAKFNYKSVYFSVGPYVSFLVSDKTIEDYSQHVPLLESVTAFDTIPFFDLLVSGSFPAYKQAIRKEVKNDKNIRNIDVGVIADISYRINGKFTIGARYVQGLLNYRSPEIYKRDYISSLNFYFGYILDFSNKNESFF